MFRNKIPETLKPGCLCNGMKTPDHDYELHLGGTAKSGIQKTLDLATRQWKQPTLPAKLPSESFSESFGTMNRYVRNAPGFQVVLARNFLFALFISVIPALMPVHQEVR